jgi:hypothetical protein
MNRARHAIAQPQSRGQTGFRCFETGHVQVLCCDPCKFLRNSKCRRLLAIGTPAQISARLRHPHLGELFLPAFPPVTAERVNGFRT